MILIPLSAVPNQTVSVVLANQVCDITLRQNGANMYFTLRVDDVDIVSSRIVRNKQLLCIDARYQPFVGDMMFLDTQGDTQPIYTELASGRYELLYLSEAEIEQL